MRVGPRCLKLAVVALVAGPALPAAPQQPPQRPIVVLSMVGDAGGESLRASLAELLSRIGVELRSNADATPSPYLALVVVDGSLGASIEVAIHTASGRRFASRIGRGESPALLTETIGFRVQSVVEELLRASRAALAPAPFVEVVEAPAAGATGATGTAPAPAAPEEEPKPTVTRLRLQLEAFFGGEALSSQVPFAAGVGIGGALRISSWRWAPGLGLAVTYHSPFGVSTSAAAVAEQMVASRLVLSATPLRRRTWRLDVGVGGGLDVFYTSSSTLVAAPGASPPAASSGKNPSLDWVLSAQCSLHFLQQPHSDFFVALAGDVDPQAASFVVNQGGPLNPGFAPWRVRPTILLGFSGALLDPQ